MKKIFFVLVCFFGFIAVANSKAALNITVKLDLSPDPNNSSYDITSYPNSINYPGNYEVNMQLGVMVNTGQSGKFSTKSYQRKRTWNNAIQSWGNWGVWNELTPNLQVFPNLGPNQVANDNYAGTAKTTQYEGTQIEYYVRVTFVALNGGGSITRDSPTRTATILGVPVPCFSMYNIESIAYEPSYYGPIEVKTICTNAVTIDGSCTKFENGYHIGVSEFNKDNWTFIDHLYLNWIPNSVEAPSFISLNALAASNNKSLSPGKLYLVNLSIGPEWKSATPQFFRVVNCFTGGGDSETAFSKETTTITDSDQSDSKKVKLYPNPANDILTISLKNTEKLLSYTIFNNSGVEIKKERITIDTNSQEIDVKGFDKAIYFISIETDKTNYREKFAIE